MKQHFRMVALQCNFQSREQTLAMPERWHDIGFDAEQLLHTHADLYSAIYDPVRHRELMREYLERSRANRLRTVVYMNCHILGPSLKEHFQDWCVRDERGGQPLFYDTYPACCLNSGWREYFDRCMESLAEFEIEGLFFDGPHDLECWCPGCRAAFARAVGKPMEEASGDERARYRRQRVLEFKRDVYRKVKAIRADWVSYFNEGLFAGRRGAAEMAEHLACNDLIGTEGGFFFYGEPRRQSYWRCAAAAKMAEAVAAGRPTVIFFAGDHKPWSWFMHTPTETRLCYASALGNGASVWYGLHCHPDNLRTRTGEAVAEMVRFDRRNDRDYQQTRSLAEVAVFYSFDTASRYRKSGEASDFYAADDGHSGDLPGDYTAALNGAFGLLEHLNLPYDIVTDLKPAAMLRHRVLLVPCGAMLSAGVLETMKRFVEGGGRLVADGAFGRYDENGVPRTDGAAGMLTGGTIDGAWIDLKNFNYFEVDPGTFAPDNAFGLLPAPAWAYPLRAVNGGAVRVRCPRPLCGRYEGAPGKAELPIGTWKNSGSGSVLYVAAGLFEFYENYQIDGLREWLGSVIRPALTGGFALVNALPGVSMTVRETAGGELLVHLTNYLGAVRPLAGVPAVSGLELRVPVRWTRARDLRSGREIASAAAGVFRLPPLEEFSVIRLSTT